MPKYVLAYHGGSIPEDPAAQAEGMAAWGAWFGSLGDAVIDGGNPTSVSKTVTAKSVTDGGGAKPAHRCEHRCGGDAGEGLPHSRGGRLGRSRRSTGHVTRRMYAWPRSGARGDRPRPCTSDSTSGWRG